MSEMVMEQKAVVVPFGKRNANRERIEREEAELKQLSEENVNGKSQNEENGEDDSNLSAEEKSFKKRYGDLRRHSQQQALALQKQIDELKQQLTQSTEQQIKLPTSEDELATWAKTYPDVAKIVETIAIKKAKEQTAALDERFKALDERDKLTAREKAELELLKLHPDFDTIRDTDDFHNWADEQPAWVQQALYENDTDARSAARAIDLYKVVRHVDAEAVQVVQDQAVLQTRATEVAVQQTAVFVLQHLNEDGVNDQPTTLRVNELLIQQTTHTCDHHQRRCSCGRQCGCAGQTWSHRDGVLTSRRSGDVTEATLFQLHA